MPDVYLCPAHTPDLTRRELHYNNPVEGKMPEKHVDIRFSHNVSLTICVSLRNMGSVKCNEMADLIDSSIHKDNQM